MAASGESGTPDAPPLFSIILPAYNEESVIGLCLDSVRAAADTAAITLEIFVMDNGSTDKTATIAEEKGAVVTILPTLRLGALRNAGVDKSRGELLLFLDSDMLLPPTFFDSAKKAFADRFDGIIGFTHHAPDDAGWVGRTWGTRASGTHREPYRVESMGAGNLLIRRTLFDALGRFDERLATCEDKDFTLRASRTGVTLLRSPKESLIHLGYEKNVKEFIVKEFWRQGGAIELAYRFSFAGRTLKHPLLSLYTLCAALAFLFALTLPSVGPLWLGITGVLWAAPAALITLGKHRFTAPPLFMARFFFLTLVRWTVSGAALLYAVRQWRSEREAMA